MTRSMVLTTVKVKKRMEEMCTNKNPMAHKYYIIIPSLMRRQVMIDVDFISK